MYLKDQTNKLLYVMVDKVLQSTYFYESFFKKGHTFSFDRHKVIIFKPKKRTQYSNRTKWGLCWGLFSYLSNIF